MTPPNILLMVSDDQRYLPDGGGHSLMDAMPYTKNFMEAGGRKYTRGVANIPVCGPSRATMFSGQLSHHTGLYINDDGGNYTGFNSFQRLLKQNTNYFTGLIGKYMNGLSIAAAPWWDFKANIVGKLPDENDNFTEKSALFFDRVPLDQPWLLTLGYHSPHVPYNIDPGITPPTFVRPSSAIDPVTGTGGDQPPNPTKKPGVGFANMYLPDSRGRGRDDYIAQYKECAGLDLAIADLIAMVPGDIDDTLIFYISDNGFEWGEHWLASKQQPYLESPMVPYYIRWPNGGVPVETSTALTGIIDIAPTIYEVAGIDPTAVTVSPYTPDGQSLLTGARRDHQFIEFPVVESVVDAWRAVWFDDGRYYISYKPDANAPDGFTEDYDLTTDPTQINASNVLDAAVEALWDWDWPEPVVPGGYDPLPMHDVRDENGVLQVALRDEFSRENANLLNGLQARLAGYTDRAWSDILAKLAVPIPRHSDRLAVMAASGRSTAGIPRRSYVGDNDLLVWEFRYNDGIGTVEFQAVGPLEWMAGPGAIIEGVKVLYRCNQILSGSPTITLQVELFARAVGGGVGLNPDVDAIAAQSFFAPLAGEINSQEFAMTTAVPEPVKYREIMNCRVSRLPDDAGDTLDDSVYLLGVEFIYSDGQAPLGGGEE